MKGCPLLFLLILFAFISCGRSGKNISAPQEKAMPLVIATAAVDKALISTDDTITFSVVINRDASVPVTIPDIGSRISGFRVTDFGTEDKDEDKSRKVTRKWFLLRADVSGSYVLPEVEIRYTEQGKETSVKTSEIFVEVQVPKADADKPGDDLRDIKDIEKTPPNYLVWAVATGIALVLLGGGYFWYQRKNRKPTAKMRLAPHEAALKRLDELEIPIPSDTMALKRFYFSLSEIIRSYVEDKYGFRATDMTSEEIIKNLRGDATVPESEKTGFTEFLKETDIVKFTDFYPSAEAIGAAKERVRFFVMKTTPESIETESVI